MTVKELIKQLKKLDENTIVYVGCEGYTNRCDPDDNIQIFTESDYVLITDNCYYSKFEE